MATDDIKRVLIVGGGVGGLEAALALRALAPERVEVTMLAPSRHFTYRALSVGEPFGHGRALRIELAQIAEERGFQIVRDALDRLDTDAKVAYLQEGEPIAYDALIVALGARAAVAVPGALTFRGPQDSDRLRGALEQLREKSSPRIIFAAGGGTTWTLPLYELALMTADWAERAGIDAEIQLVTAEPTPLHAFGPVVSADMAALLERSGIVLRTGTTPGFVEDDRLWVPGDGGMQADLVVALPFLSGPRVDGLPSNSDGFVEVDEFCGVRGVEDVYAVGDIAAQELKQGGLAAQQADVAAKAIAAAAGEPVSREPYVPVLRALLLTGREPRFLRNPPAEDSWGPAGDHLRVEPWWPPHKIVGVHLAPYLATHADLMVPAS